VDTLGATVLLLICGRSLRELVRYGHERAVEEVRKGSGEKP